MPGKQALVPVERIERAILLIRGQKVMLDADLAEQVLKSNAGSALMPLFLP